MLAPYVFLCVQGVLALLLSFSSKDTDVRVWDSHWPQKNVSSHIIYFSKSVSSLTGIGGSNPAGGMSVACECCEVEFCSSG